MITPPHVHIAVHPECRAGWSLIITLAAPGVHGDAVAGTHGAGENTPSLAAVAAATTGLDIVPHIPKVGMLTIGANAWMFAAGVSAVTGVPIGTTASGTGIGGIAIEHEIIAPSLTSGGTVVETTPLKGGIQHSDRRANNFTEGGRRRQYGMQAVLPEIQLDDVRFQELVSEARTRIVRHSPDWTDHNVSDPGITLIELFAWLSEILIYRINRIPERLHLGLLELVGLRPAASGVATADVRFLLDRPGAGVTVPAGTEVSSPRTASRDPIVFATDHDLVIPVAGLAAYAVQRGGEVRNVITADGERLEPADSARTPFGSPPSPDDALLLGFGVSTAGLLVRIVVDCAQARGFGIDPADPPLTWESSGDGGEWHAATIVGDETGGFVLGGGTVTLELPHRAGPVELAGHRLHWLRCRLGEHERPGGPAGYSSGPEIAAVSALVAGGHVPASHAATVAGELLGVSDGSPGASYPLAYGPVLALAVGEALEVREPGAESWVAWQEVTSFQSSSASDRHFLLDRERGEVRFGPAIRQPDGGWRRYGAVPVIGSALRMSRYRHGGGREGDVAPHALTVLASPVPGVAAVTNPRAAAGGVDAEPGDRARDRARLDLRARSRAVTAEDFERLTVSASPKVARAVCVGSQQSGPVRVHVVPRVEPADRLLELSELVPGEELMRELAERLDEDRLLGTSIRLLPVALRGVSVVVDVRASPLADPERVQHDVAHALYVFLNPLVGGSPDGLGAGWPVGRALNQGELYGIVYAINGVEFVNILRMYETDLATGAQAPQPTDSRIVLGADELIASGRHIVKAIHRE